MKRLTYKLNRQAVENLLIKEWHIAIHQEKVYHTSLERLGISTIEVNWFLHLVEWNHQVSLPVEEVSIQTTLRDFIQLVLQSADHEDSNWVSRENRQAS
jgi:hypothetical protein